MLLIHVHILPLQRQSVNHALDSFCGINLPLHNSHKYLGFILDARLLRHPHIQHIQQRVLKASNILKTLSSVNWRADTFILSLFYKSFVRSILDGSFLFCNCFVMRPNPTFSVLTGYKTSRKSIVSLSRLRFGHIDYPHIPIISSILPAAP